MMSKCVSGVAVGRDGVAMMPSKLCMCVRVDKMPSTSVCKWGEGATRPSESVSVHVGGGGRNAAE